MSHHLSNLAEEAASLKVEERYCHSRSRMAPISFGAISCLSSGVLMLGVWATSLLIPPVEVPFNPSRSEVVPWNQLAEAETAPTAPRIWPESVRKKMQRAALLRRRSNPQSKVVWQAPPPTYAMRVQSAVRTAPRKALDL
jgi:hypothetical protein